MGTVMVIDGAARGAVREAILAHFESLSEFRIVVSEALDRELPEVLNDVLLEDNPHGGAALNSTEPVLRVAVFDVVRWSTKRGKLPELVATAARFKPESEQLRELADRFGGDGRGRAETVLKPGLFLPTANWATQLGRLRRCVCRVEPQPPPDLDGFGTGFLVARDIVMTNFHVVKNYPKKPVRGAGAAVFRFDYEIGPDGASVRGGRKYELADDWLLAHSPDGKLDYALVRLHAPAGDDKVQGRPRGYLEPVSHSFAANENLVIFQYPNGRPLSHKMGQVIRPADGDWVTYNVNTEGGSSGAPCVTEDLRVVAIHHWGFDNYNRGVRFTAILKHLRTNRAKLNRRGLTGVLGL